MFTVVIPLFNKAPYIQRALDSVYSQSFPPEEIIVVNDGSTDEGERIAKSQADPRVRVIDQSNRGASAARNTGIAAAAQPFIAFLDADDRWLPDYLAHMKQVIKDHPGAVLYGAGYSTFSNGRCAGDFGVRAESPGRVDFFREWSRGHLLHTCTTIVPKAAAEAVGGFGAHVTHGDDYFFWVKMALSGPVVLSPKRMSEYDISVPGQIIEYYRTTHTKRFDVFEYQRLLAGELRRQVEVGKASPSLVAFCKRDFCLGLLQRLYWGNFPAMRIFCEALAIDGLPLGQVVGVCKWLCRRRWAQPPLAALMGWARALRSLTAQRPE